MITVFNWTICKASKPCKDFNYFTCKNGIENTFIKNISLSLQKLRQYLLS